MVASDWYGSMLTVAAGLLFQTVGGKWWKNGSGLWHLYKCGMRAFAVIGSTPGYTTEFNC